MKNLTYKKLILIYILTIFCVTTNSYGQKDLAMLSTPCCADNSNKTYSSYSDEEAYVDYTKEYELRNDIFSKHYLKTLIVNTTTLNLRKGPDSNYEIITTVAKFQKLIFLAMEGDWIKVRIDSSNVTGFVFYKHVAITGY